MHAPSVMTERGRLVQLERLPVFPSIALELMDLLDEPECSVRQIAEVLRREPTLAAEVLAVSNSARYIRLKEAVLDLDRAVVVIGLAEARRVALNAAVRGMIGGALGLPEFRRCWGHCVAAAIVAEACADAYGAPKGRAYAAGLLHDLGMLALLTLYPDEYQKLLLLADREDKDLRQSEWEVFGQDHEMVGGELVARMGLPAELRPVLSNHHDCVDITQSGLRPLIAASDRIANLLGYRAGGCAPADEAGELLAAMRLSTPQAREAFLSDLVRRIALATA